MMMMMRTSLFVENDQTNMLFLVIVSGFSGFKVISFIHRWSFLDVYIDIGDVCLCYYFFFY